MTLVPLPYSAGGAVAAHGADASPQTLVGYPLVQEESLLLHYWRIAYRRRWLIASCIVAGLLAALAASLLMERRYTAVTRIQIAREAAKVIDMGGEQATSEAGRDLEFYQTQYALLKSRSLSEAVVRELRLQDNYTFLGTGADAGGLSADQRFKRATELVNRNTRISPLPGSSIVDVGFESRDPRLSATISNTLAEKFIETSLSRRYEATEYARNFLQNRIAAVRAKLEESERKAAAYAQAQGIIKIAGTGEGRVSSEQTLASADLSQLSAQLAIARGARIQAEADYRSNVGGTAATNALNNSAVNTLRQQRAELTAELSKLTSDFGPEYPKVVALQAQISELDRQIGREQGRVATSVGTGLRDKYRQALAAENALQARVNGLKSAVLDQDQRSIQFNIIQRDVDTNRSLYDALLQRFKEVGVAAGVGTNNVSVVDEALIPTFPSSPNIPLNLALGLLMGLLAGGGLAFVREQLADNVVLPGEFQQKLGVPLLGSTPKLLAKDGGPVASLDESKSELAEAYFSILTSIQFSTAEGTPASLLVTSARPGEGKSTTATAIARQLASVGAKVLLIDGDMRNPSLHKIQGMPLGRGLSDLIVGHADWSNAVHATSVPNLFVMMAGRIPPNPAELLSGNGVAKIIELGAKQFDHVIIDGPPVLGLADAPLLARATEATVFVMESMSTKASQARHALQRLTSVRARVAGVVLTKLDAKQAGYSYGYGYSYQYKYVPRLGSAAA